MNNIWIGIMIGSKKIISKCDYECIQNMIKDINDEECGHISKLRDKLKNARKVAPNKVKYTVVTMNTKFRLKNIGNGFTKEFVLVFPKDSNWKKNRVSILEEMGSEVFAGEVGDVIQIFENNEKSYFLIEAVLHQPEATCEYN